MAGFQIATGYVEVEVKYDRRRLMKQADEAGKLAGERFDKSFSKRTSKLFKNLLDNSAKKNLRKDFEKLGDDAGKAFQKSLNKSLGKGTNKKLRVKLDLDTKDLDKRLRALDKKRAIKVRIDLDDSELKKFLGAKDRHIKIHVDEAHLIKDAVTAAEKASKASKAAFDKNLKGDLGKGYSFKSTERRLQREAADVDKALQKSLGDLEKNLDRKGKAIHRLLSRVSVRNVDFIPKGTENRLGSALNRVANQFSATSQKIRGESDATSNRIRNTLSRAFDSAGQSSNRLSRLITRDSKSAADFSFNVWTQHEGEVKKVLDRAAKHYGTSVSKLKVDFDREGNGVVRGFLNMAERSGRGFSNSLHKWMQRSVELTRYGIVAIAGIIAAALPYLGAVLGTGITLAFGAGIAGLGILAAAQSEAVKSRFSEMKNTVVAQFREMAKPLEGTLIHLAGEIERLAANLEGPLSYAFKEMDPVLRGFFTEVVDGFSSWGPTITSATDAFNGLMGAIDWKGLISDLGQDFKELFDVIGSNPEVFAGVFEGLFNMVGTLVDLTTELSKIYVTLSQELGPEWQVFKSSALEPVKDILVDFKDFIVPELTQGLKDLMKVFGDDPEKVKQGFEDLRAVLLWLYDAYKWLDDKFRAFNEGWQAQLERNKAAGDRFKAAVAGVWNSFMGLFDAIGAWWSTKVAEWSGAWSQLKTSWSALWDGIKGVWNGFVSWLTGIGATLWNAIVTPFYNIYMAIVGNSIVPDLVNGVISWFRNLWNAAVSIFNGIKNFLVTVWNGIKAVVTAVVSGLVSAVRALFSGFVNGVRGIFSGLRNFFSSLWNGIKTVFTTVIGAIVKAARALFSGFVNGLRGIFSGLRSFFTGLWNGIRSVFATVIGAIVKAARALFQGFVNGVKAIFNGIKSFFSRVWNGVKSVFVPVIRAIVNAAKGLFGGWLTWVQSVFNGLLKFFRTVWNTIRRVVVALVKGFLALVRGDFDGFKKYIEMANRAILNFLRAIWNRIKQRVSDIVGALVKWVKNTFGSWISWIQDKFRALMRNIDNIWKRLYRAIYLTVQRTVNWVKKTFSNWVGWIYDKFNALKKNATRIWNQLRDGITNVVKGVVKWVKDTFSNWVGWIYDKFNALKKNATRIWNQLRDGISNVVKRVVKWVKDTFSSWVGWIYDKFNALKRNATNIWDTLRDNVERIVKQVVNWVKRTFSNWVGWIYDKFNALKSNATRIWDTFRDNVERIVKQVVKWVKDTFSSWVGWIYDKFNALKTNATNIWNSLKDSIVDKVTSLKDSAMDVINDFKDGVISAFENTKNGVAAVWDGIKNTAKTPINWVIDNVYNNGIRKLWNHIAGKVGLDNLPEMDNISGGGTQINHGSTHPATGSPRAKGGLIDGYHGGGILPGKSRWQDGDDQLVPMRRGEGVAISEAMEIPALKNQLLAWNHIGVKKGKGALRRFAGQGYAEGGIPGKGERQYGGANPLQGAGARLRASQEQPHGTGHEGFAIGGILSSITDKVKDTWSSIKGGIVDWISSPMDKLKDNLGDRYGKKKNFKGIPYHGVSKLWDSVKDLFQGKDDEENAVDDSGTGGFGSFTYNGKLSDHKNIRSTKPHVRMIGNFINSMFKPDTMWGMGGPPEHSTGRAIDYMVGTGSGQKRGDGIASMYTKNPGDLGLQWVIWRQKIWNAARKSWRSMSDRGDSTQNHMDHPHVFHKTSAPKAKDFIAKQKGVKFSGGGGGGGKGGSGNTMMTSFWDTFQPMANGKRMSPDSIASSVIPLGSKLRVKVGGKSAVGSVDDLGPNSFVYRRHHPKALLDLAEPMMQKLTGRRSNVVNGSFSVTKKGSGRTLFGYTKWNGVFDPKKGTNGFATGGVTGGPGSVPLGQGSHDIGGILPDGHTAHNRSGEAEMVMMRRDVQRLTEALENGKEEVHFHGDLYMKPGDAKDIDSVIRFFQDFKRVARANGAHPKTRTNY